MKLNFQQKLVLSFIIIFAVFATGIVVFEQGRARRYKTEALGERLDAYADEILQHLSTRGPDASLDTLLQIMPPDLRITLVDHSGRVTFDNAFSDPSALENHSDRPEIASAAATGRGMEIRTSASNDKPYLYYAKNDGRATVVRVALPYNIRVQSFLKPDNAFLYFVLGLLVVGFVFIYYVSRYFGRSVRHLRDFSEALNGGNAVVGATDFPDDDFGEIAGRLVDDFNRIGESRKQLSREREKLLLHIQTSAEGVCFFNADRTVAFYNGLFMHYLNTLSGGNVVSGHEILSDTNFAPVTAFLDNAAGDDYYETRLGKHGKEFLLRLNIFDDRSFEIILNDITAQEKNKRLKQEMTGNIAHELRTPVTSIRGFLEILLDNDLDEAKSREYLQRAYSQTKTLSNLIADMRLLTRIDEKQEPLKVSDIDMNRLLDKVRADTCAALAERNITLVTDIPTGLTVKGNESLLYSIFRNLTDNVVTHAGSDVQIVVEARQPDDDREMVRFSFADNGRGIVRGGHLARLFERFYRVGEGRTRETGGSGLGLSIVKNAVQYHGGTINVHNVEPHGLRFVFTLPMK